jgi:hypothetical protein
MITIKDLEENSRNIQKEISNQLCDFLKSHSLISVNALEEKLKIPQSTIGQALNGKRLIPMHFLYPIILELVPYGFKPNGYDATVDEATNHIFMRMWVRNIETIEMEEGTSTGFSYIIEEYRTFATNITDF